MSKNAGRCFPELCTAALSCVRPKLVILHHNNNTEIIILFIALIYNSLYTNFMT
jgi:hypothetical protein